MTEQTPSPADQPAFPRRSVEVTRRGQGAYTATNARGASIDFGHGETADFTPVELLLAAVGGCSGIDVDAVMSRRGEPTDFVITVSAQKLNDGEGVRLADVDVDFRVQMPAEVGDVDALIDRVIRKSRDADCTVSRTVEHETPVTFSREGRAL